jgi:hypothetical protein
MYIYSLIVNVCRRPRSPLPVRYVNHTILGNKHLFQNGRALLKCRSFILLQLVIPTLKSHAATRHVTTRKCHCEQTFQDGPRPCCLLRSGFRACCVVVVVPLQPQFRYFAANRSSFSLRKFVRFSLQEDHRSLCVVLAVLLLSFTPATVSPVRRQGR